MESQPRQPRFPFTLVELVYVVSLILILASAPCPGLFEAPQRARVSHVLNDLRSVAIALEAYESERGAYPPRLEAVSRSAAIIDRQKTDTFVPWTLADRSLFILFKPNRIRMPWPAWTGIALLVVFAVIDAARRFSKRTPKRWPMAGLHAAAILFAVAFASWLLNWQTGLGYYRRRELAATPAPEYGYWTDGRHYVLQGVGVNEKPDLADLSRVPMASRDAALRFLAAYSYDPTNGTATPGDIFRVGIAGEN
ncbi:MAG: type II secretion system protein [Candidatus Sumerlaeia bacterium]